MNAKSTVNHNYVTELYWPPDRDDEDSLLVPVWGIQPVSAEWFEFLITIT